jgi:hypothetical protein
MLAVTVPAAPLKVVNVGAPAINCVFDAACTLAPTDTAARFALPGISGYGIVQTRTFAGKPRTAAEGLYGYEYRIDLRDVVIAPRGGMNNCVISLSFDFGPVASLDFDGDGSANDQVFVIASGGIGNIVPAVVDQVGRRITVSFTRELLCLSQSSYFIGLVSAQPPRIVRATLVDSLTASAITSEVRAPVLPRASLTLTPTNGFSGASFTASGRVASGSRGVRILWGIGRSSHSIAEGPVDSAGAFSLSARVPSDAVAGDALVSALALGSDGSDMASATFTVLPTPRGSLTGRVVDQTGGSEAPVAGVVIRLLDAHGNPVASALTDGNGAYTFPGVQPGNYNVVAIKDGFYFADTSPDVSAGGSSQNNVIAVPQVQWPAPAVVTFVGGIAVPLPNSAFNGSFPILVTDQGSAKSSGTIAKFPSLPQQAGAVHVRFWADVQFPNNVPASQRKVRFEVLDGNNNALWSVTKPSLQTVYPPEPALNFEAWTSTALITDMNINSFPPGDLALRVTPFINDQPGQGKIYFIEMVDLKNRWFRPWVRAVPDPATLLPVKVFSATGQLGYLFTAELPVSSVLPFELDFTVPIFNKTLENRLNSWVPAFQELFVATPGKGLQMGALKPSLSAEIKLLGKTLFSDSFPYIPELGPNGRLKSYKLPKFTAAGPTSFATIPLYQNGPGVGCFPACLVGCEVCAGWKVTVDFTISGQVDLSSAIYEDLSMATEVTPTVDGTLGGHIRVELVICHADANVTGTIGVGLPFRYESKTDSAGFQNPCVSISGSIDADIGCLGLGFGGGGSIGPATIYGCNNQLTTMSDVKLHGPDNPFHVDPSPSVAANGNGEAMSLWVEDESTVSTTVSPFIYYSRFDGQNWTPGGRLTQTAALVHEPKAGFLAQDRALAIWVQNKLPLSQVLSNGQAVLSNQEIYYSVWNNGIWTPPAAITDDANADGSPTLAVDPATGRAMAAWVRRIEPASDPDSNLYGIAMSFFNGASWSPLQIVDSTPPAIDYEVSAQFDSRGTAWLAWLRDADGDLTNYTNRQLRVVSEEIRGGWVGETIPGVPAGAFSPSLALDSINQPLVAFTVPPSLAGELTSGAGNRSTLWTAYKGGRNWSVAAVGQNMYAESPVVRINPSDQATIMFRGFSADQVVHRDGDVAAATANLSQAPLSWAIDFLTEDNETNWKLDFAVDRETRECFVVNVKQSPLGTGIGAPAGRLSKSSRASSIRLHQGGSETPVVANMVFANLPDLSITDEDVQFSKLRPVPGEPITITATIRNLGLKATAGAFSVKFYAGDPGSTAPFAQQTFSNSIPLSATLQATAPYTPAQGGMQTIHVVVDADNALLETIEANNSAQATLGTLAPPSQLVVVSDSSSGQFTLAWITPDPEADLMFSVYRSTTAGSELELIGTTTDTTFADSFIEPGVQYFYSVAASDNFGVSSPTGAQATAVLPPPLNVTLQGRTIVLSWRNPATGFFLQEATGLTVPAVQWQDVRDIPTVVGDFKQVSLAAGSQRRFYRLARP